MIIHRCRASLVGLLLGIGAGYSSLFSESDELTEAKLYPEIKIIRPGLFNFGGILIDRNDLSFSFEGKCNQLSGLVEYALVHESGKTHESLFSTKIAPRLIHACFLLLKQKPDKFLFEKEKFSKEENNVLRQRGLDVWVKWDENGSEFCKALNSMTLNDLSKRILKEKSFLFTGSKLVEGEYLAQIDGSIIAIYRDSRAIVNAIDELSSNDDVWLPNEVNLPPLGKNVWITIKLPKSTKNKIQKLK